MQLGTQTASLVNHLQSRAVIGQPDPVVGMGATVLMWTDRKAATIFRVFKSGKATMIEVREDHSKVVKGSGHDGSAEYEHKINVNGYATTYRQSESGKWDAVRINEASGRWVKTGGAGLRIGHRETYRDPSF